jgi:hypothetical protein
MHSTNIISKPRSGLISITVGKTHGKQCTTWSPNPERVEYYKRFYIQPFQGCNKIRSVSPWVLPTVIEIEPLWGLYVTSNQKLKEAYIIFIINNRQTHSKN